MQVTTWLSKSDTTASWRCGWRTSLICNNYSEVRPLRSVAVTLNWVFLIRFQDRPNSEKQEINIRFATPEHYRYEQRHLSDGGVVIYPRPAPEQGLVEVEIHYTARTWGNDVDGLIKGHIEGMKKKGHLFIRVLLQKKWLAWLDSVCCDTRSRLVCHCHLLGSSLCCRPRQYGGAVE